ncbi:MAG: hypothetical protein Q8S73_09725 [Deltaproteobacteria bacterium]|nr:hypothetical protein [Deltaproteobacteria bacterium]
MTHRRGIVLSITLGLLGCASARGQYRFSPSAMAPRAPARSPTCEFSVTATVPSAGYEEVGLIEFQTGRGTNTAADYHDAIAPQVCAAAGDLVVGQISNNGTYIRGVVMRRTEPTAPAAGAQ